MVDYLSIGFIIMCIESCYHTVHSNLAAKLGVKSPAISLCISKAQCFYAPTEITLNIKNV